MDAETRRWETSAAEETEEITSDVTARSDVTLMDPTLFAELLSSLDEPDNAPVLSRAAAAPRRSRQA